jgi:tetratricopeptide (TPR) repeat protein
MKLKPKHVRRLILLAGAVCALVVVAFLYFVVRDWQKQRLLQRYREQALAAAERRDWPRALDRSGSFLNRDKRGPTARDPEMLRVYAKAREQVQESDRGHLRQAVSFYQRLLEVEDDPQVRRNLLDLYNRCGFFAEAADAARHLRPALDQTTTADLPVLEQEALALLLHRSYAALTPVFDRISALDPLNLQGNLLRVEFILQARPEGSRNREAREFGEALMSGNPEDPRARIVAAAARARTATSREDIEAAQELLSDVAGLEKARGSRVGPARYQDATTATRVLEIFDSMRAFDHSLEVLRDADDRFDDAALKRTLVRRLWQESADEEVVRRTASLDVAALDVDPEVAGFRALSLLRLKRTDEYKAIAGVLKGREGDYRLTSWAKALAVADEGALPATERVSALREAVRVNPGEPVFMVWLGESLQALSRSDEAREFWAKAVAPEILESRGWALPHLLMAETLLAEGRTAEAVAAAEKAREVGMNRVYVNVVYFEVQAAQVQRGSTRGPGIDTLLTQVKFVEGVLAGNDSPAAAQMRERLLVPRLIFLAALGKTDEARQGAMEALQGEAPLSAQALQRLMSVNALWRLGLDEQALAGASQSDALPVLYQEALQLAASGKGDEARKLLRDAAAASPRSAAPAIAYAKLLDRMGDPGAMAEWKRIGETFPGDLPAQRAVLTSPSVASDREFVEATINRYQAITGTDASSEDTPTRVARARALLAGAPDGRPTARDRDRAIALLSAVVSSQPALVEPKLMLAAALAMTDPERQIKPDLARATRELTEALALEPRSAAIAIDLGRLHQLQSQFDRSRELLARVARDDGVDLSLRRRAAEMLVAQGEPVPVALKVLEEIAEKLGDQTPSGVLVSVAEIYEGQRRAAEAEAIYERLAAGAARDAESVHMTARHYILRQREDRAQAVLALLDKVTLQPGDRELIQARLSAERGNPAQAVASFEAAAAAAPTRPEIWRQYARMYLVTGDYAKAREVASRGLRSIPGDLALAMFESQSELFERGQELELRPLVQLLTSSRVAPEQARAIIEAAKAARDRGDLDTAEGLGRLADRFPASPQLQMFVASRMAPLNGQRAVALVNRAIASSPADPGPARLAAAIYLQLRRWNDMLQAAQAWRDRDLSRSVEPDLAIAQAQMELGLYQAGLATLQPHLEAAIASPEEGYSLGILNVYAQLMVRAGRESEARSILAPAFQASSAARSLVGLGTAASHLPTLSQAQSWIDAITPLLSPDSVTEQIVLATSHAILASRFPDQSGSLLRTGASILERLTAKPETGTAPVWEALGIIRHRLGDAPAAEEAYRKAIAIDPRSAVSLNNLANIEAETSGDLDGALELARRAVAASDIPEPDHIDTLGAVHFQIGKREQAAGNAAKAGEHFRAAADAYRKVARARPRNPDPWNRLALASQEFGDSITVAEAFDAILRCDGLTTEQLAIVRNNLATALIDINRGQADLDRARELMTAAMGTMELPEFYDTLGWLNLRDRRPVEAQRAFEQAIERSSARGGKPPSSSLIGMATILAGDPTADSRKRAADLLASINPAQLDPRLRVKFDRAGQLLRSNQP